MNRPPATNLQLWYDGVDPLDNGTLPEDNSKITTWKNKAGISYNAVKDNTLTGGGTAYGRTDAIYKRGDKNCLYFNNSAYNTGYPANPGTETAFIVFNKPAIASGDKGWATFVGKQNGRSYTCGYWGGGADNVNSIGILNSQIAWVTGTTLGSVPNNKTTIANFSKDSANIPRCSIYDTTYTVTGSVYNAYTSAGNPTYLGVDPSQAGSLVPNYSFIGYIMEIIVYNVFLDATTVAGINSYLKYKWVDNNGIINNTPPCFLPMTRILTPTGYRRVETLENYNEIETSDGRAVPVKVFRTHITKTTQDTAPYVIPRGAISLNIPDEDLHVSGLHAIQDANGMWQFPMTLAMHKDSGVQQHLPGKPATYYHLECPNYFTDNLVANGCVAESFRNKQGREGITFEYCEEKRGFVRNREEDIKDADDIPSDVLAVYC